MCHKQTDHGRVVDITFIPTTCCGEIFWVHNVEIAHVTLTTLLSGNFFIGRVGLAIVSQCTKFEVSIGSPVTKVLMAVKNAENVVVWGG